MRMETRISGMENSGCIKTKIELGHLIRLALPTMLTQLLRFINPSVSIMVCGHLSREELDASSLANTLINVLGLCIDTGFSSAFDTLFSQAYGSKNRRMLGVFLQRAISVVLVMYSILACIHLNVEPLLLLLRQDPLISSLTSEYLRYFLPGLACDFLFLTLTRYLQAQNIVVPMVYASLTGTVFNLWAQYTFVLKQNLGIRASALCLSASFAIMLLVEIAYILISRIYKESWSGFDLRAATDNWGIIFRMGIPGLFMVSLEEWCFELMTFISGAISEVTLGAQAIAFQVQSVIYMIPLGLFTAVNVRVGQKLGAYDPDGAKFTFRTAQRVVCFFALSTGIPVILLRNKLPLIFTDDEDICALTSKLLPMLLLFQLCEGFAGVSEAVLLACGRQSLGAVIIFVGYYCIGIPLAFLFAFGREYGIIGAWTGLLIGFMITTVAYNYSAYKTNWVAEARQAHQNIYGQQDDIELSIQEEIEDHHSSDSEVRVRLIGNSTPNGDVIALQSDQRNPNPFIQTPLGVSATKARICSKRKLLVACLVLSIWILSACAFFSRPNALWRIHCMNQHFNRTIGETHFCDRMLSESNFVMRVDPVKQSIILPLANTNETILTRFL